jgi:hypothetical protein
MMNGKAGERGMCIGLRLRLRVRVGLRAGAGTGMEKC